MVSLNLMGLVDTFLIGKLGTEALAASGLALFLLFIHTSPLLGFSTAVQALTAKAVGEKRLNEASSSLNLAIFLSLGLGLILTIGAISLSSFYLGLMTKDKLVQNYGVAYLDARLLGMVAIGITHSFRGFWTSISKPRIYLKIILVSHIFNALLSYALIFGLWGFPKYGIAGAGYGSTLATFLAVFMHFGVIIFQKTDFGFFRKFSSPGLLKELIIQSVPSGMQQLLFALGHAVFLSLIARLGAKELAASNVIVSLAIILIYPGMAMGMMASTYAGREVAAGNKERAYWWVSEILKVSILFALLVSLPLVFFPSSILSLFIQDQAVVTLGKWPLALFGLSLAFEIAGYIYMYSFFGLGKPQVILKVNTSLQWLGLIPAVFFSLKFTSAGLIGVWLIQCFFRSLQTLILKDRWKNLDI